MPPARRDLQLLLVAGGLAVLGGVMLALVLFLSSGRSESPRDPEPYVYGPEDELRDELRDGGPFYVADPFGGEGSIVFALENEEIVAVAVSQTALPDCSVKWRAQLGQFTCGDRRFRSDELERFEVTVPEAGMNDGLVVIDVRKRLPPPAPAPETTTTSGASPPAPG